MENRNSYLNINLKKLFKQLISFTFSELNLKRFISFNESYFLNIEYMLLTSSVLKFEKNISSNDIQLREHTTHINNIISVKLFKIY